MTPLIDRATAWLCTNTADSRLVADQALTGNLRRLRWLLPVIMVLNIVCVVVFWWAGDNLAPQQRAWKSAIGWTHLGMAIWMLVGGLVAYWLSRQPTAGRTGRWLAFAAPMSLILFTVAFTVIDQRVTPNISLFLLGCAFVGLLLLTRPAVATVLFAAAYAIFYAGLGLTQDDPVQLLTNRVSGFFAALLGLALALVSWQKNTRYVLLQRELKSRNMALLQQQEELVWLAKRDALTGLFNRGEFLRLAEAELLRAQRYRTDTSAIMVDMIFSKASTTYMGIRRATARSNMPLPVYWPVCAPPTWWPVSVEKSSWCCCRKPRPIRRGCWRKNCCADCNSHRHVSPATWNWPSPPVLASVLCWPGKAVVWRGFTQRPTMPCTRPSAGAATGSKRPNPMRRSPRPTSSACAGNRRRAGGWPQPCRLSLRAIASRCSTSARCTTQLRLCQRRIIHITKVTTMPNPVMAPNVCTPSPADRL